MIHEEVLLKQKMQGFEKSTDEAKAYNFLQKNMQAEKQAEAVYATVEVPTDIALKLCKDIYQEHPLMSKRKLSCWLCLSRGKNQVPHKFTYVQGCYTGCANVGRRYVMLCQIKRWEHP